MDACVLWHKSCDRAGYGVETLRGKTVKAHRVAYCEAHGLSLEDIVGKVVRHACDNPPCVNPAHLSLGTQADNVQDMILRGRHASTLGTQWPRDLSMEDRAYCVKNYIPRHPEFGAAALGRRFGVTGQNIHYHLRMAKRELTR